MITDAAGTFATDLYSLTTREQCLIVTAVAGSDTARVWRAAEFQTEETAPDTPRLTITLGED